MAQLSYLTLVLAPLLASSAPARSQTTILRLPDPLPGSQSGSFGWGLCGVEDVNADGSGEFLVASWSESTLHNSAGAVRLYSGVDGAVIHVIHGTSAYEAFGRAVCGLGDVNGDGGGDFAVAWRPGAGPGVGGLRFYSGSTAALLFETQATDARQNFAGSASAGDVDGDGIEDVAVPIRWPSYDIVEDGLVWVFSGADGSLLLQVDGLPVWGPLILGTIVAAAGDIDLDGHDDLIVSSASPYGLFGGGLVRVVSGADGTVLRAHSGAPNVDRVHAPVGSAGDWNGDGRNDYFLMRYPDIPGYWDHGVIEVRSGADDAVLQSLTPSSSTEFYRTCVNVGDVDGDGLEDLGISSTIDLGLPESSSTVRMLAGGSGQPLFAPDRDLLDSAWTLPIAGAGDVSGDGLPDVLCGLVGETNAEEVVLFAGIPLETGAHHCVAGGAIHHCPCFNEPAPEAGTGCVNSTGEGAKLTGFGIHLHLNDELELHVSGAPPDVPVVFLRSTGLGSEPAVFSDGQPCLFMPWVAQVSRTDAAGSAGVVEHPGLPHHFTAHYQAWYRDHAGGSPCGARNNFTPVLYVAAD